MTTPVTHQMSLHQSDLSMTSQPATSLRKEHTRQPFHTRITSTETVDHEMRYSSLLELPAISQSATSNRQSIQAYHQSSALLSNDRGLNTASRAISHGWHRVTVRSLWYSILSARLIRHVYCDTSTTTAPCQCWHMIVVIVKTRSPSSE